MTNPSAVRWTRACLVETLASSRMMSLALTRPMVVTSSISGCIVPSSLVRVPIRTGFFSDRVAPAEIGLDGVALDPVRGGIFASTDGLAFGSGTCLSRASTEGVTFGLGSTLGTGGGGTVASTGGRAFGSGGVCSRGSISVLIESWGGLRVVASGSGPATSSRPLLCNRCTSG